MDLLHSVVPCRQVAEWSFHSQKAYANPFIDVALDVIFTGPDGQTLSVPAFFDGSGIWKVRFNPPQPGSWQFRGVSTPPDPELDQIGAFRAEPSTHRGTLRATPETPWGFQYESGEAVWIFGDTVYNLFAMDYCGGDVKSFLERRAQQGFNLLRIRVPVSPYHPPDGYSAWQTRRTNPWGGSETAPRFDQFNLDYFQTVDKVIHQIEVLEMGVEMIMEAWGFEFPFNSRSIFLPEWEELWMRYLIARYDAYNCIYFWTPLNEYEFYPNGDWNYKQTADRWALRIANWIKKTGPRGHIVSMHNGPVNPPFAQRFASDPGAVDAIMFQTWGTVGENDAWLAGGIEEQIEFSFKNWWGSAVLAEWGYERNPAFDLNIPGHIHCDREHTRRGAWRGAFSGMGIIHGFENSWGPWMLLGEDQPGMAYLLHLNRFIHEIIPFERMRPSPELIQPGAYAKGSTPRALSTPDKAFIVLYFPTGGQAQVNLPAERSYQAEWFDPRSGETRPAAADSLVVTPSELDSAGHPLDYVLVLKNLA